MHITSKQPYQEPRTEVLDLKLEGIICLSSPGDYDNGGDPLATMMLP